MTATALRGRPSTSGQDAPGDASRTKLASGLAHLSSDMDRLDTRHEASHEEILACVEQNPDLVDAVAFTQTLARRTDCPASVVAFSYFTLARIAPQDAVDFWTSAADKVGLRPGDPVIAMTNRFAEARRNRERLTRRMYLSAIYRAWNYRRAGKPLRLMKINSAAGGIIPIPEPK